jgi:hypothetical protein
LSGSSSASTAAPTRRNLLAPIYDHDVTAAR